MYQIKIIDVYPFNEHGEQQDTGMITTYHVYLGDKLVTTCHTYLEAIDFIRNMKDR